MALSRRTFSTILASPPALRTEICRSIFGGSASRSFATPSTRGFGTIRIARNSVISVQRTRIITKRSQSTTAPTVVSVSDSTTNSKPRDPATKPPRRSRLVGILTASGVIFAFFTAAFAMAAAPAAETVNGFTNPPTDAETLEIFQPATQTAAEINEYIVNHPLSKKLRTQDGMTESRPHLKIPPAMRAHNLTAGTLLGEDMIEVPPLTFNEKDAELPKLVQMSYLGPALCGHPGIVHGGMLATMLDEGLARTCFPALPNKVGVTASLKIDYRLPCPGSSYVVLKAETTKVEGRKAWVKGWIELLGDEDGTGTKIVEAEALFIEPKQAKSISRFYSTQ